MAIQGLEQAVENLSRISKTAVPGASAMAINRVASSAISQSASQVARETKVRRKLVKERARLKRATVKNPQARIKVSGVVRLRGKHAGGGKIFPLREYLR